MANKVKKIKGGISKKGTAIKTVTSKTEKISTEYIETKTTRMFQPTFSNYTYSLGKYKFIKGTRVEVTSSNEDAVEYMIDAGLGQIIEVKEIK